MNGGGSPANRNKPHKEYRRSESQDLKREIRMLQNQVKKLSNRSKKRAKKNDDSSISSVESDNASY
jgi:uncharacterized protein YlxW (UPF0749 family)